MPPQQGTKRQYSFLCPLCKMITFLNFEEAAAKNAIVYLKRRQFVFKLRQQIKDEKMKWEKKKNKIDKVFVKFLNNSIYIFYCKTYFKL